MEGTETFAKKYFTKIKTRKAATEVSAGSSFP
jgi:hypothetical protein